MTRIAALALVALLAACTGQSAADTYAAAAAEVNKAFDQHPDTVTGTLDEWHAWAKTVITADQAFAKTLQGLSVSGHTADDVHALLGEVATEITAATAIGAATTIPQVAAALASWPRTGTANLVRLDLGLPPVGASVTP